MGQVTVPSSCRMKQLTCPSDWMPQTRFDDEKKAQLFIGYLPDGAEALGRRKSAGRRPMEGRASCGFFWEKWRRGSGADHLHAQAGELGGVFGRDVRCGDDLPDVVDLTELNMGAFFEFRGVGQTVELVRIA